MNKCNLPLVILFACLLSLHSIAQEYSYKHYGIKDGIAGNHVYHAVQDHEGFLWFATETGVSRFDGTSFKNFTTAEGLPDNEMLRLFVDSKGRVWMIPFKNDICYYEKGRIYNSANARVLKNLPIRTRVMSMIEDRDGNLYFLEPNNLILLKKDLTILQKDKHEGENASFFGAGTDSKGTPLVFLSVGNNIAMQYSVAVKNGLLQFLPADTSIKFWGNKITYCSITPGYTTYNQSNIFQSETNIIVIKNNVTNKSLPISVKPGFNSISFIHDSIPLFNTNRGAYEYSPNGFGWMDAYLKNDNVSSTLMDHEQNMWFTTLGNGIYRLYSRGCKNVRFKGDLKAAQCITAIGPPGPVLMAGSDGGDLYTMNEQNGTWDVSKKVLNENAGMIVKIFSRDNDLYILERNALVKTNPLLDKWSKMPVSDFQSTFKDAGFNKNGELFFATHQMVFSITPGHVLNKFLLNERATALCFVDSGVYTGTLGGLKFIDRKNYVTDLSVSFPTLRSRVTRLLAEHGRIWVGTNESGLVCFDGRKVIKNITVRDGLPGSMTRALYADSNYLWVGTDKGISKISLLDKNFPVVQRYTIYDGLGSNMINAISAQGNKIYAGTTEGVSVIDENLVQHTSSCMLRLLGITVSGKERNEMTGLSMRPDDNNIRFDFVAISYKSEGDISYFYKLSGIDDVWNKTKQNFLLYPTLPSGKYRLQLYAANKFGVKSNLLELSFEIEKHLYEKSWFILLGCLVPALLIWLFINWRIKKIREKQNEQLANTEKIASLEQQALIAQMNPHFIFNCLNSIQQFVIEKDVEGANRFIAGFAGLIRQTLDNSGKHLVSVAEEESYLRSYLELEKSRFEDKFEYRITIDPAIQKDMDCIPPMLIQPYVENSIMHGIMHKLNGKGTISIEFALKEDNMICTITDNGVGRAAAGYFKRNQQGNHLSIGTAITGQRISLMNKNTQNEIVLLIDDLTGADGQPDGTKVSISIPLKKINQY